jgi:hypothetical protein
MGETRNAYWGWAGMPEKKDCLEELGLDGRIIFEGVLKSRIT